MHPLLALLSIKGIGKPISIPVCEGNTIQFQFLFILLMTMHDGKNPGYLERGVQPLKKGTHGGGAAPDSERRRREALGLPQKKLKIQVLICVLLASGNKIPRLSLLQKSIFFWRTFLVLCNERVPFFWGKFWFCVMNECLFRCS
jgi:hypothetical protein